MQRPDLLELYERIGSDDREAQAELAPLDELIDAEVVWDVSRVDIPDMGVFEAVGDHVVYGVVVHGRSRRTGVPVDWHQTQVMTFRDGRVVTFRIFKTRGDALASLA
jgi:hypothetical protein